MFNGCLLYQETLSNLSLEAGLPGLVEFEFEVWFGIVVVSCVVFYNTIFQVSCLQSMDMFPGSVSPRPVTFSPIDRCFACLLTVETGDAIGDIPCSTAPGFGDTRETFVSPTVLRLPGGSVGERLCDVVSKSLHQLDSAKRV